MIVEQIYTGCLAQGAYYIESAGEVAIIDPLREVHSYQNKADKNGYIGPMHKNIPSNLIELCNSCHETLHVNKLQLFKQETSNGQTLALAASF